MNAKAVLAIQMLFVTIILAHLNVLASLDLKEMEANAEVIDFFIHIWPFIVCQCMLYIYVSSSIPISILTVSSRMRRQSQMINI